METTRYARLEQALLAERQRLQQVLDRLSVPPADETAEPFRFGDDVVASTGGASSEDDHALAAHTLRELGHVERTLAALRENPRDFGICATCSRPIPRDRLILVPGTRYCRTHAPQ